MTGDLGSPRPLWALGDWRCLFNGIAVQLFVGGRLVRSRMVGGTAEIDRHAAEGHASVEALIELEAAHTRHA